MNRDKRDRLEAMLKTCIQDTTNYVDTKIAPNRALAYEYYYGEKPAPKKNSPTIVKKVVFEKVNQAIPQIKEPFLAGRDVVKFVPYNIKDGYGACIASAVVNRILKVDNNIDKMYTTLISDGLIAKNGVIKVFWEESEEIHEQSFENLTREQIDSILEDENVEVIEEEEEEPEFNLAKLVSMVPQEQLLFVYPAGIQVLSQKATDWESLKTEIPEYANDIEAIKKSMVTYSGTFGVKVDTSTVKVRNIAPEDFLIDEYSSCISTATFVAERSDNTTISDLLEMGFQKSLVDLVEESASSYFNDLGEVKMSRNSFDDTDDYTGDPSDPSTKFCDLYECYVKTAMVENDVETAKKKPAKLYQMYIANGVLLEVNEVDKIPYFSWTPLPVSHKFFGQSMAETLFAEQESATHALRGAMQYLAFSTNPRYKAIGETEYNLAAFQANLPGSVVPVTKGDLVPFQYPQLDQSLFQVMGTIAESGDGISGVSNMSAGLNSDALRSNVSATAVALTMDASQRRIKEYAINLASQCIKPAYAYVYELYRKNAGNSIIVQVDGKDIEVDPQSLPVRNVLDVDYSLGKNDKLEHATFLLQARERIMNNPQLSKFHTPSQAYNLEMDIMTNTGIYDINRYVTSPVGEPVQPSAAEQQAMQMQQEQLKVQQLAEQNKQAAIQLEAKKLSIEERKVELRALEIQANIELKRMELDHTMQYDSNEQVRKDEELLFKQELAADQQELAENELEVQTLKITGEMKLEAEQQRPVSFD